MRWLLSNTAAGVLRFIIAAILGAICLMFQIDPSGWILTFIASPPAWVTHPLTRVAILVLAVAIIALLLFWDRIFGSPLKKRQIDLVDRAFLTLKPEARIWLRENWAGGRPPYELGDDLCTAGLIDRDMVGFTEIKPELKLIIADKIASLDAPWRRVWAFTRSRMNPNWILLAFLLAAAGIVAFQIYRGPAPDPRVSAFESELASVKKQLADFYEPKRPTTRLGNIEATTIKLSLTPYDIGKRQQAIDEISGFIDTEIIPVRTEAHQLIPNWDKHISAIGPRAYADRLDEYRQRHAKVMSNYKQIWKRYDTISDMLKLETDLGFMNTSQTEKLVRELRQFPETIAPETLKFMQESQTIKDLMYEYKIISAWPQKAKEILRLRRTEWSSLQ